MKKTITELEKDINFYTKIAWVAVFSALVPIGYAGFVVFIESKFWQEADLGSFIGGVSGTLTALAGVFFVYVAFLGQRISIIQQQIELQETQKEIKGQTRQLELQNQQFQIQSYETTFFNLLEHLKKSGPMDRISKIYLNIKEAFNNIDKEYTQSPSGGIIWKVKKNSEQLLQSKKSFTDIIINLEDRDSTDIYDAFNMLLSILHHIDNHKEIKNNHKPTLHNNLSHKEKFVFFYFYLTIADKHNQNHQLILFEFFEKMDRMAYFHESHKEWAKNLPH